MPSFALYFHWPFCETKCPYCDFNSHVRASIDEERWLAAYIRALDYWAKKTTGRTLTSIFFGGGTPSLMQPETVAAILNHVKKCWSHDEVEITLEANPSSIEAGRFAAFRQAGINRVSIGVQSLRDDVLQFLERPHNAAEARKAIEIAAKYFDRYSFDLIYGRPQQTIEEWSKELREALPLTNGHLSAYQLTIEQGTRFATQAQRGDFIMPDEDTQARFFETTIDLCAAHGLAQYEISNFASIGQESQHNLNYWRMGDYIGIGAGAHGRVTLDGVRYATIDHRAPESWLEKVETSGYGGHPFVALKDSENYEEAMMMGLRLAEGVNMPPPLLAKAQKLASEGYLDGSRLPERLKPTRRGLQCINAVTAYLLS